MKSATARSPHVNLPAVLHLFYGRHGYVWAELLVAALFVAAATSGATFQVAVAGRRYFLLHIAGSGSGAILTGSGG